MFYTFSERNPIDVVSSASAFYLQQAKILIVRYMIKLPNDISRYVHAIKDRGKLL